MAIPDPPLITNAVFPPAAPPIITGTTTAVHLESPTDDYLPGFDEEGEAARLTVNSAGNLPGYDEEGAPSELEVSALTIAVVDKDGNPGTMPLVDV